MHVKAIEGIVENGRIRLQQGVALPENSKVYVFIEDPSADHPARVSTPRLADPRQSIDFVKEVVELPGNA